ncbi:cysteine hydrolase domain-containing protein (plasmid) [Rhizobium gallicum bv. gallicum R602sp]|uniref:Cysteine hydrolase domain-containing protein n=1 Tax=Rhizobium gallicum bv. gallicum R602sp TaxID=1041138 RepID=A0A0B4XHL5_9HYPH|nr:cysteine hydrolase domain-containing protein [Rhizobium gallicum bv. gallicum R602sp]
MVLAVDRQPANHSSFASNHDGGACRMVASPNGEQVPSPDHCLLDCATVHAGMPERSES